MIMSIADTSNPLVYTHKWMSVQFIGQQSATGQFFLH